MTAAAPAGPAHVLVVDDQAEIRRLLGITLRGACQVLEAGDGATALVLLRRQAPRLVLLDVMMPGRPDGLEVLDRIRADPQTRHIPVAMLSARGQLADREAARARGADAYFTKPFSPSEVLAWVRATLAGAPPAIGLEA